MDKEFKPDKKIVTVWFIIWFVFFFLFYLLPLIPMLFFGQFLAAGIFSICVLPWFLLAVFWIPKFHQTIIYQIHEDHIRIEYGVWWQQVKTIPFRMITDIKIMQGPLARVYQFGNLMIQTAGMGAQNTSEGTLSGLTDYKEKQNNLLEYIRGISAQKEPDYSSEKKYTGTEEQLLSDILNELKDIKNNMK